MLYPPESIEWVVAWYPDQNIVVVFKSPYLGNRQPLRTQELEPRERFAEGLQREGVLSYILPPGVEAAIGYLSDAELELSR